MKVRLSAGTPATNHRGGRSAPSTVDPEEAAEIRKAREWLPRNEPDTPLACGCKIPWPVITLLGSGGRGGVAARDVMCDVHGWQPRISKTEIDKAKRRMKTWQDTKHDTTQQQQSIPDEPPF